MDATGQTAREGCHRRRRGPRPRRARLVLVRALRRPWRWHMDGARSGLFDDSYCAGSGDGAPFIVMVMVDSFFRRPRQSSTAETGTAPFRALLSSGAGEDLNAAESTDSFVRAGFMADGGPGRSIT